MAVFSAAYCTVKRKHGILSLPVKTLSIHNRLSYNGNTILFIGVSKIGVILVINAEIPFKKQKSCNVSL